MHFIVLHNWRGTIVACGALKGVDLDNITRSKTKVDCAKCISSRYYRWSD